MKTASQLICIVLVFVLMACSRTDRAMMILKIDRSFDPPVEFRLYEHDSAVTLRTIIYPGIDGQRKGPAVSDKSRLLTPGEARSVMLALKTAEETSIENPDLIELNDGSRWRFTGRGIFASELTVYNPGVDHGRHTKSLYDLGALLWHLGGLEEVEKDIY